MLNDLLYNLKTAYVAVFLMGIVSIFILGGNDLLAARERVLEAMYGQNELGIDVSSETSVIIANSAHLLVLAQEYIDASDRGVTDVRNALSAAEHEVGLSELEVQFALSSRVISPATALIEELKDMDIDPRSARFLTEIETNINTALVRIDLSGYYALVVDFNRLLRNPYTGMIAAVRGIDELNFSKLW